MSFTDFMWRGVCPRVAEGLAGRGGGWGVERGGACAACGAGSVEAWAAEVRLLEPVQHEDVAKCPKTDAPQEASLCC